MIAFVALIAYALANVLSKNVAKHYTFTMVYSHGVMVALLMVFFHSYVHFSLNPLLILMGLSGTLSVTLFLKALSQHETSLVVPISAMSSVLTPIAGVVLFKESVNVFTAIALLLSFAAIIIISWKKDKAEITPIVYALLGAVFGTTFNLLTKYATLLYPTPYVTVMGELYVLFFITLSFLMKRSVPTHITHLRYIAIGVLLSIGAVAFYTSIKQLGVAITLTVLSATPVLTLLLAHLILKERLRTREYVGVGLMVLALILVQLSF